MEHINLALAVLSRSLRKLDNRKKLSPEAKEKRKTIVRRIKELFNEKERCY